MPPDGERLLFPVGIVQFFGLDKPQCTHGVFDGFPLRMPVGTVVERLLSQEDSSFGSFHSFGQFLRVNLKQCRLICELPFWEP